MCNVPFVLIVTSYPIPHPVIIGDDVFTKNVGHGNTFQKRGMHTLSKVTQTGYSVKKHPYVSNFFNLGSHHYTRTFYHKVHALQINNIRVHTFLYARVDVNNLFSKTTCDKPPPN